VEVAGLAEEELAAENLQLLETMEHQEAQTLAVAVVEDLSVVQPAVTVVLES
jgi:hypothetical protein